MAGKTEHVWEVTGSLSEDCQYLILDHSKMLRRVIRYLVGERLEIKFSKLRQRRSDAQNRYIWGVLVPTVMAWRKETEGKVYEKDEVYAWLRISLLGHKPEIRDVIGETVIVMTGKRFSKMTTKEFAEAVETMVQELAERGCEVPLPREQNFITDHISDD